MKKIMLFVTILLLVLNFSAKSQTDNQYAGWLLWLHNQKISTRTSINIDLQLRSFNHFEGLKSTLIRPSFNYLITKNLSTAIGYTFLVTKSNVSGSQNHYLTENMIWEQLQRRYIINKINFLSRIRLEHRFIEQQTSKVFSQRMRFFVRSQTPIAKTETTTFSKGAYFVLQEEVFFNLQNKNQLNTHFFDQNRIFGGFGYRFNKRLDIETGYLNQAIKGKSNLTNNNVFQVVLFTKLENI